MSDIAGILPLPVPVPLPGEVVADPLLGNLLSYFTAIINAECGAAWAAVFPSEPLPVKGAHAWDPKREVFSEFDLPALYMWRGGAIGKDRATEDWWWSSTTVELLWVFPTNQDTHQAYLDTFRNAITKSIIKGIALGRHPAWQVPGDTYYDPDVYGSVLTRYTGTSRLMVASSNSVLLEIAGADSSTIVPAVSVQLTVEELTMLDADLHGEPTLDLRGTVTVGGSVVAGVLTNTLTTNTFQFHPVLSACTPATGPQAGGTAIVLTGTQLGTVTDVTIGGVPCTGVVVIDECTVLAVSPAHAAGVVAVVATQASGASASLAAAFTYV